MIRTFGRRIAIALLAIGMSSVGVSAQQGVRRATTVPALAEFPAFFHGQPVRVRGELVVLDGLAWLLGADQRVLLGTPGSGPPEDLERVEVLGVYWDPGRMQADDPRLARFDVARLAEQVLGRPWPGIGEMPIVAAESIEPADLPATPTVTSLSVDPERWLDERVTIRGRFRGRNLFGDLPAAPGQSRWDFILQVADSAVWVTGVEPRGRDFNLDPQRRVDTGQWLEASGVVRSRRGLIWLEAEELRRAEPVESEAAATVRVAVPPPPPPEVIFSAPTADEIDVPLGTSVRVQFSRDMDPDSFRSRVRIAYLGDPAPDEDGPNGPAVEFTTQYLGANRVLEIRFESPLERFRTVRVDLLPGIRALDGSELDPWWLMFSLGG